MNKSHTTIRIWGQTVKNLRMIYALTGMPMVEILDRIVLTELEQVQINDSRNKSSNTTQVVKDTVVTAESKIVDVLSRRGPMTIRELTQYTYGLGAVEIRIAVQKLIDSEDIRAVKQGKTTRYIVIV